MKKDKKKVEILLSDRDAIRPFITEYPEQIYDKTKIEVDIMFALCSLVCIVFTRFIHFFWFKDVFSTALRLKFSIHSFSNEITTDEWIFI